MAQYSMDILNRALTFCTDVWTRLVDTTGMWGYYLSAIVMLFLLRYLLAPIFGHQLAFSPGQSDVAAQTKMTARARDLRTQDNDLALSIGYGALDD